ncbi:hypothetical protein IT568_05150 [bacterium]|nr:hypothetical protein [bacterium]
MKNSISVFFLALTTTVFAEGLNGFVESGFSPRLTKNDLLKNSDFVTAETRLQLSYNHFGENTESFFKIDFVSDQLKKTERSPTERSSIREAFVKFSPLPFLDVKAGRQILTYGVGDLLFVNDVFPKDWNSFFAGRDIEYLKNPDDAIKFSAFSGFADLDFVLIPVFEPDKLPEVERFTFWNGKELSTTPLQTQRPAKTFENCELSTRLSKNFFNYQTNFYFYKGFWKTPKAFDGTANFYFPKSDVYGTSFRGQLFSGIFAGEFGFYNSKQDKNGNNPLIENSSYRYLVNFEKEIIADLTGNVQFYSEIIKDFDKKTQASGRKKTRNLITTRLTQRLFYETLTLSLFVFYGQSDKDFYLRPEVNYSFNDNLKLSALASIFGGKENYTMFGQNENNSNLSLRLRYSF